MSRRFRIPDMERCLVDEVWRYCRDVMKGVAEESIGSRRTRNKAWISKKYESLLQERIKAKITREQFASRCRLERYPTLDRQVRK